MSENDFLNALKEEMPEDFGRKLLAELKAEETVKPMPSSAIWTVAAACFITVLVGLSLFLNRNGSEENLNTIENLWSQREPITPANISQLEPILTLGNGYANAIALSPDNMTLAVATTTGIYLHNAQDLNATPRILGMPAAGIRYIEYSQDGRLFAFTSNRDGLSLYQWDETAQTYNLLYNNAEIKDLTILQMLDISPDGKKFLFGTCTAVNGTTAPSRPYFYCQKPARVQIEIIDIAQQTSILSLQPSEVSNAVIAINPDWTKLAYQQAREIILRDIASGEEQAILTISDALNASFPVEETHHIYFNPNGEKFGIVANNGAWVFWWALSTLEAENPPIQARVLQIEFPIYLATIMSFNPITQQPILSALEGLRIYDYFYASPFSHIPSDSQPVDILVSSDGQKVYALGDSGIIRVWDWETHEILDRNLRYSLNTDMALTISPDSMAFANSSAIYPNSVSFLWESSTTGIDTSLALESDDDVYKVSESVAISQDRRYVAYVQNHGLWVYDRQMSEARRLEVLNQIPLMAFREDGTLIVIEEFRGHIVAKAFTPEMLITGDVPYPMAAFIFEDLVFGETGYFAPDVPLVLSPDAKTLLGFQCRQAIENSRACAEIELLVFDTGTGEILTRLESNLDETGHFINFAFTPDSQWFFMSYCAETISGWGCQENKSSFEIWKVAEVYSSEGQLAPSLHIANIPSTISEFSALAYSDSSFLLATTQWEPVEGQSSYQPFTSFWHIQSNGEVESLYRIQANHPSIAPDKSYILTTENGQIQVWAVVPE